MARLVPHTSHWGAFSAEVDDSGELVGIVPHPADPDPSPLLDNLLDAGRGTGRLTRPLIRKGWLRHGPGPDPDRGRDDYVPVSWDVALDRAAEALGDTYSRHGAGSVFGGSYGWASAGRFHHAQSQVHRFLNCLGGYTASVNNYSYGASMVLLPHILGVSGHAPMTSLSSVARHTDTLVAFGGMPLKNSAVSPGGSRVHGFRGLLGQLASRDPRIVLFSPNRQDLPGELRVSWQPIAPGTDTAVLLALAHELVVTQSYDAEFVSTHCVGFDQLRDYVLGRLDGVPKSPAWAAELSGVPARYLTELCEIMVRGRTMISVTFSLQRAEFGEQVVWAAVALAALLGQIGLPGGGFAHGYGSEGNIGFSHVTTPLPSLPQGTNGVRSFIPVARISDLLLHPGEEFRYDGGHHVYPEIHAVYWAGGNPFHHHQDLNRLARAFTRPDTVIVNDPYRTATGRHADIVLPSTITLEREDIGASRSDPCLIAMHQALRPYGDSRDDYWIFTELARRLDCEHSFTEGRDPRAWLRHLYEQWAVAVRERDGWTPAGFDEFWQAGELQLAEPPETILLSEFRADPEGAPLATPSGRIELASETIASFGYADCPGHPAWLEPTEWHRSRRAQDYPLVLLANQPATRLHSQLADGPHSASRLVEGKETLRMHPADAAARHLVAGSVVRVFNDRGECLAGLAVTDDLRPGVVQLSTGAPWEPLDARGGRDLCVRGNVNVLTRDAGASTLSQGPIGARVLVEVAAWDVSRPADPPPARPPHDAP